MSSTLPAAQQQAQQSATTETEKRGAACTQIALSARHGSPASTVVAVVLPFACLGADMTERDLPGMGSGARESSRASTFQNQPTASICWAVTAFGLSARKAHSKATPMPNTQWRPFAAF